MSASTPSADRWLTDRAAVGLGYVDAREAYDDARVNDWGGDTVFALPRYEAYRLACQIEACDPLDPAMWEVHGAPYGPLPVEPEQRCAVVYGGDSRRVSAYLPASYEVHGVVEDGGVAIVGRDVAGWTLDDYVLPRLASGGVHGVEVVLVTL